MNHSFFSRCNNVERHKETKTKYKVRSMCLLPGLVSVEQTRERERERKKEGGKNQKPQGGGWATEEERKQTVFLIILLWYTKEKSTFNKTKTQ